ncbi:MAG: ECF-type sigma factor [Blastocatellia bacterium]|nr:ECF-type sigma factor [Blastocatellia bacterium]
MAEHEITTLLMRVKKGDAAAEAELLERVYPELKRIAARRLRQDGARNGLQTTELVNEAYLRVFGAETPVDWQGRVHFFAVIAQKVRFILVDHARKRHSGGHVTVELDDSMNERAAPDDGIEILALNEALERLAEEYPRQARVVELRYFGGMTLEEIADELALNITTIKRDWTFAKSWLYDRMSPAAANEPGA